MRERKSTRLRNYDYSKSGYYFITICTKNGEEWFGRIEDGKMIVNPYGEVARSFWIQIRDHFKEVGIDEFLVMPNHLHGILIIEEIMVGNAYMRSLQDRTKMLLSKVIQQYKSSVSRIIHLSKNNISFQWQRSFYDHVIRNEIELSRIRDYIQNNPLKWDLDRENPSSRNFDIEHDRYWTEIYNWV
jgi:REP element-mobilizing transposase RayT